MEVVKKQRLAFESSQPGLLCTIMQDLSDACRILYKTEACHGTIMHGACKSPCMEELALLSLPSALWDVSKSASRGAECTHSGCVGCSAAKGSQATLVHVSN